MSSARSRWWDATPAHNPVLACTRICPDPFCPGPAHEATHEAIHGYECAIICSLQRNIALHYTKTCTGALHVPGGVEMAPAGNGLVSRYIYRANQLPCEKARKYSGHFKLFLGLLAVFSAMAGTRARRRAPGSARVCSSGRSGTQEYMTNHEYARRYPVP
jgi:hypothetical protein